ncbi:MAG: 3-oxoacyl-ACP reductase FabG [Sporichthya sp.]|nr:3-oxoacyl-ACP reductase FabG [Sporichthya sp.]
MLQSQIAVVTGAAQGIGEAIARRFAQHGAHVVLVDLNRDALELLALDLASGPGSASVVCADVSSPEDHETVHAHCRDDLGGVHVLVNNAGINRDAYLPKMSLADFDQVISVSLRGAWLGIRTLSPLMRAGSGGSIVNMSSLAGKIGNPGQTNYSAAKAGLIGLTKAAAKELGGFGIRVNAVQPGLIRTAMTERMKPEVWQAKEAEVPLGRAGTPDEVAAAVLFLASPMGGYISGAVLEVSGGRGI